MCLCALPVPIRAAYASTPAKTAAAAAARASRPAGCACTPPALFGADCEEEEGLAAEGEGEPVLAPPLDGDGLDWPPPASPAEDGEGDGDEDPPAPPAGEGDGLLVAFPVPPAVLLPAPPAVVFPRAGVLPLCAMPPV